MSSDGMADILSFLSPRSNEAGLDGGARSLEQEAPELAMSPQLSIIDSTDEALLQNVSAGSKEALAVLFRRYRRAVLNVAKRILRDECEAEDLCQEVFLQVFQKANLFDSTRGSASSWIIQVAYHRSMNRRHYLMHRQHYQPMELDADQIGERGALSLLDRIDAEALLNRLRDQLTGDQQRTLELFFFEGYNLREIAETLNQSLGNVRHHYYRALERLRANVFPGKND